MQQRLHKNMNENVWYHQRLEQACHAKKEKKSLVTEPPLPEPSSLSRVQHIGLHTYCSKTSRLHRVCALNILISNLFRSVTLLWTNEHLLTSRLLCYITVHNDRQFVSSIGCQPTVTGSQTANYCTQQHSFTCHDVMLCRAYASMRSLISAGVTLSGFLSSIIIRQTTKTTVNLGFQSSLGQ